MTRCQERFELFPRNGTLPIYNIHECSASMDAVVISDPGEYDLERIESPPIDRGQVLVEVKSTTICGSDLKILQGKYPDTTYPHVPGHEWAGEVIEVGDDVSRISVGDRVGAEPHIGCGECRRCMEGMYNLCVHYGDTTRDHAHIGFTEDGGVAEYVAVNSRALHTLPESLTYDEGVFCEVVGVALWAMERAGVRSGDDVLVVGPGAIGLAAVQLAQARGADQVMLTGTRESRLQPARELGVDHTINIHGVDDLQSHIEQLCGGGGADVVMEFAGTGSAARQAIQAARRGGAVVLAGATSPGPELEIELREIVTGHKDIYGSVANPKWICERGLKMIASGNVRVNPLATHHFPLAEFDRAVETFRNRDEGAYRVLLHP